MRWRAWCLVIVGLAPGAGMAKSDRNYLPDVEIRWQGRGVEAEDNLAQFWAPKTKTKEELSDQILCEMKLENAFMAFKEKDSDAYFREGASVTGMRLLLKENEKMAVVVFRYKKEYRQPTQIMTLHLDDGWLHGLPVGAKQGSFVLNSPSGCFYSFSPDDYLHPKVSVVPAS